MGLLFIRLGILFATLVGIYFLYNNIIYPLLFKEEIDEKLEDAVEQKIKEQTNKKVNDILNSDADSLLDDDAS